MEIGIGLGSELGNGMDMQFGDRVGRWEGSGWVCV